MNARLTPAEEAAVRFAQLTKVVNGSKLLDLDQRTEAWHDWRDGKDLPDGKPRITGTAAGVCFGNNPFKTPHQLWREMLGLSPKEPVNWAMQRGTDLEDIARQLYVAFTGNQVVPMCAEHPSIPWAGASLDGIDPVTGEIINEIKCVGKKTHSYAERGILPDYYIPQVQWQFFVSPSTKEVHYWSLDAEEIALLVKNGATVETHVNELLAHCKCVIVRPDLAMQKELYEKAAVFRQHLIDGTPPAGDAWLFAARQYVLAKQAAEEAAEALKIAERQLIEVIPEEKRSPGNKLDGGGVCVTYYEAEGSVDYAKLFTDYNISDESVEKYRKPSSIRKRISLTGEMPIPVPDATLALPTDIATGPSARGFDQW